MIVCDGSGNWPTWLRSEEVFENFILRLEYKTFWGGESGVFFHAPLHGRVSEVGFEVQIGGRYKNTPYATGAIFAAVAPLKPVQQTAMDEGYNTLEIVMNWPKLKVTLNGVVVQDLNCEEHELLRFKPRLGYIGFQDRGKPVHFRNVRIKRLPDQVRDQWKPMLKGNSLTRTSRNHTARSSTSRHSEEDLIGNGLKGWTVSKGCTAKWTIDDRGVLVSENGHGYLVSDQQYRNCEFQTYFQTTNNANGGIFFGWLEGKGRGFEIQIEDIPDSNDPSGSIYGRVRAKRMSYAPGDWVLMQVRLNEKHCAVRLNGVVVAESHEMGGRRLGNISLQMHRGDALIRWKDMKVRRLPSPDDPSGMK